MTSIDNLNLYDFIEGQRANTVNPEESGFRVNGNVGQILNLDKKELQKIHDGILYTGAGITNHTENTMGRIHATKHDWKELKQTAPDTPLLYCNNQYNSELLPYYPNGIKNTVLSPNCNMMLGSFASPTLYGETTAFVNDLNVLNNPSNNIGHEVEVHGIANQYGMRALGQGKNAYEKLQNGNNTPTLEVQQNKHGTYITNSIPVHADVPLYQVGNWLEITDNFLKEFNNNIGESCKNI